MLRGFRWQFLALLVAASLFVVGLIARLSNTPQPVPPTAVSQAEATTTPSPTPPAVTNAPTEPPAINAQPTAADAALPRAGLPTYREALIGRLQRLNPLLAGLNPVDRDITSLIFEGLIQIDQYGQPMPLLASDWVMSSDGLEYVFMLREDVLWQDGTPFTADDVVYTMSVLSDPDFPGPEEIGHFWQTVEVEKLNLSTVRFRLTQPLGSFLNHLTIGLLPYHAFQGATASQLADHPFNLSPIGTGPYQLEGIRSTTGTQPDIVDLRVAPVYRNRPEGQDSYPLERVSFYLYETFDNALAAMQGGEVDGLAAPGRDQRLPLFSLSGDFKIYDAVEPTLGVLIYNWDEGDKRFFQDQRVRLALQTGMNRATPVETHLTNLALLARSPLMPNSWAYIPTLPWPEHDTLAAQQFLETANIRLESEETETTGTEGEEEATAQPSPTPAGGPIYSFSLLVPDDPPLVNIAQEFATQWGQLNLDVRVETVDQATFDTRITDGDFDSAIVELPLGADPDVYAYWHQGQYPDGKNYGGMSDDRISEILERARRDASGINRATLYEQFQQDFIERGVAIPLYYPLFTYAVRGDIEGVQLAFIGSPPDRFRTLKDWHYAGQ